MQDIQFYHFETAAMKNLFALILLVLSASTSLAQNIAITEVHPTGSSNATYTRDWFELTNLGPNSIDITGWRMDDNSASFANSVPLAGVSIINPGQSIPFIETGDLATNGPIFTNAWFGGNVPVGFTVASYNGTQVGLSSGGDQVNIYDASGTLITTVTFGAATTAVTFDNAAGLTGTITTLSQVGFNGAFTSFQGSEIGSPGFIANAAVPEPSTIMLLIALGSATLWWYRKRLPGQPSSVEPVTQNCGVHGFPTA
jgi:hypothetical protein